MKFKTVLLKLPAALVIAAVLFTPLALPSNAQAGPPAAFVVPGCPLMPGTQAIVRKVFGPYAWSGAGGASLVANGALRDLVPPGGYATDCVFAREYNTLHHTIPRDSEVFVSGYVQLANSAARLQTWSAMKSKLGLTLVNQGPYHYAEKPGVAIGYRDGLNEVAFAFWIGSEHRLQNVPGSSLRPLVYSVVCARC